MACQRQLEAISESRYAPYPAIRYVPVITGAEQEYRRREQTAQPLFASSSLPLPFVWLSFRLFYYIIVEKGCQTVAFPFTNAPSVVTLCRRNFYIFFRLICLFYQTYGGGFRYDPQFPAPGQSAVIRTVGGEGALRQHFLDMGVIPGAQITLVKFAPMGDPIEFRIHSYELTPSRGRREAD